MVGDFDGYPGVIQSEVCPPKPQRNKRIQVWQPVLDDPEEIEEWLFMVRHDPPALLFIDELLSLVYKRRTYSTEYSRIMKLGRALPIGAITLTQELVDIPRNALGQANHVVRYRLSVPYEQQLMNKALKGVYQEPAHEYGFYYGRVDSKNPAEYYSNASRFFHTYASLHTRERKE
jgi:hypothetical protein